MSDLLQARTPGVVVSNTSGLVGAPSKIRIRGINSLSLNNDPIIILDGIRLTSQTTTATSQIRVGADTLPLLRILNPQTFSTAPRAPSRLDDIDPNTIESIDVLRGPSAASLYGTEAANGVIVIKTRKGTTGAWRTTLLADRGASTIPGHFPDRWVGWGHNPRGSGGVTECVLALSEYVTETNGFFTPAANVEDGSCVQDSVTRFHPQNDPAMRTLGTGTSRNVSLSLSGGGEQLQEFLSARLSDNVGMAKISDVAKRTIGRLWAGPPPPWMLRPNTEKAVNGSSRTTIRMSPTLDLGVSATAAYRDVLNGGGGLPGASVVLSGPWDTLRFLPSEAQRTRRTSLAKRGSASARATYTPWSWLTAQGTVGGDYTLRTDEALLRLSDCTPSLVPTMGRPCGSGHMNDRGETFETTADAGVQLSFAPSPWLTLRTALGEQYHNTRYYRLNAGNGTSTNLAFGTDLLSPAPVQEGTGFTAQLYSVLENRDEGATAGWYVEQMAGFRERLFLTAALRQDAASAFGARVNAEAPVYPKFSLSWLLSDEPFFPRQAWLSSVRLRTAYGHSGNQASQADVLNSYVSQQSIVDGAVVTGTGINKLGNPGLRPERTTEWEGGVDASFLDQERIHLEFTIYRKLSRDAITVITLAPSYGIMEASGSGFDSPRLSRSANVGSVENRGTEFSLTAKVLDSRRVGWDFSINWGANTNRLVHRDPTLSVNGPLRTVFRAGYPLYGWWGRSVHSYADADGDGILGFREVTFGPLRFMGAPYPKYEMAYNNNVALWGGAVRMNALVTQVTGLSTNQARGTDGSGAAPIGLDRCAVDPSCTLAQQAAVHQARIRGGNFLPSNSVRLSEVSMTGNLPRALARRLLRAQAASLTLAGRNLALWTNYPGKDPNVDTTGSFTEAPGDDGSGVPQPLSWTIRLNLGF